MIHKVTKLEIRWTFDYKNHAGELRQRIVIPYLFTFRVLLPWYPEPTWLMHGFDLEKKDYRDFQVSKIRNLEEHRL